MNQKSTIDLHIGRTNRNLLVVNSVVIALLAWGFSSAWRSIDNALHGPFQISSAELGSIKDPNNLAHYYVKVTGNKIFDTGYQAVDQSTDSTTNKVESETVTGEFLGLVIDQRILLVQAPTSTQSVTFVGALLPIPGQIKQTVIGAMDKQAPGISTRFLPAMLDASDFTTPIYITWAFWGSIFLLSSWNVLKALYRFSERENHPIWKALAKYGNSKIVANEINTEFREPDTVKIEAADLSRSWLLLGSVFGVKLIRLADLVWMHTKKTRHWHGFIPLGTSNTVRFYTADKKKFETIPSQKCEELIAAVKQRAPWTSVGYTNELRTQWRKNPTAMIQACKDLQAQASGKRTGG
jgi:hypothetical protein